MLFMMHENKVSSKSDEIYGNYDDLKNQNLKASSALID